MLLNLNETQTGTIKNTLIRDDFNRPKRSIFYGPTKTLQREVVYENDKTNRIASEKLSLGANFTHINYTRDALKRISEIKTVKDGNGYERKFAYLARGNANSPEGTTNYVSSISYYNVVNNVSTLEKTESIAYNADGNIVTYGENTYVYDNLGRLIRENNKTLDKTFLFVYNVGGNIVSKTEYAYTTGTVGTAAKVYNYTYGNTWKDQLTSFDGTAITYDAAGNPTSYLGKTLTWSRGRLLTKYVSGSKTVDMQYDGKGIRVEKTMKIGTSVTTNSTYIYDNGGKLRTEIEGNTTRNYIYGQDGIVGYEENGEHFMYRKNFFGDITAIYRGTTKVAEYVYDAWGNCTITLNTSGYGSRNPFRYRGYYFDSDLGMYYLTTRYYDPQTGRFINADSIEYLDPRTINGLNLYAYCNNNPVMNVDPTGNETKTWMNIIGTFTDHLITIASIGAGAFLGLMTGGGIPAMLVGALVTTMAVNNLVNLVYYSVIPEDPTNEIKTHEDSQEELRGDAKSYYAENGYINRWDRLEYIKAKNGSAIFDYNAWFDYAEYSLHMNAWLSSQWAYDTKIPLFNMIAEHSIHNLYGYNTLLIELAIIFIGYLGI